MISTEIEKLLLQPRVHLLGPAVADASVFEQACRSSKALFCLTVHFIIAWNMTFYGLPLILQAAPPDTVRASTTAAVAAAAAAAAIAKSSALCSHPKLQNNHFGLTRGGSLDSCPSIAECSSCDGGWSPESAAALAEEGWTVMPPSPLRTASYPMTGSDSGNSNTSTAAEASSKCGSVVLALHPCWHSRRRWLEP